MKAGRELDALVAERVMGWHREVDATYDYDHVQHGNEVLLPPGETLYSLREMLPRKGIIPFAYFVSERYSTEVAAAWRVVQRMRLLGYRATVQTWVNSADVIVLFYKPEDTYNPDRHVGVTDDTAPLAICRAALAALTTAPQPAPEQH